MEVLQSFVIRIYRREPDALTGVVESVETGQTTGFQSIDDLYQALLHQSSPRRTQIPFDKENDR